MKLKFGMVGGGNGAFIGNVHRHGAVMDDLAVLTAGCFTRNEEKNLMTAREWGIADESRVYPNYREMAQKEGERKDVSISSPSLLQMIPIMRSQNVLWKMVSISCAISLWR